MGYPLAARIGIPMVAQMTMTPIVPVIATRGTTPDCNVISFSEAFLVKKESKDATHCAMQKLWLALAAYVTKAPDQWEALRYVHKFTHYPEPANPVPVPTMRPLSFNRRRFAIKRVGERGEILDRGRISVTGVKGNLLDALTTAAAAQPHEDVRFLIERPEIVDWMCERHYLTT